MPLSRIQALKGEIEGPKGDRAAVESGESTEDAAVARLDDLRASLKKDKPESA